MSQGTPGWPGLHSQGEDMTKALRFVSVAAVMAMSMAAFASPASADVPAHNSEATVCSGTLAAPCVLKGTYTSNVVVKGLCFVNAGPAEIKGNLTVSPGSALGSIFGLNDSTGTGNSSLTVEGNLVVQDGATVFMGCEPNFFTCLDDQNNTLSSHGEVEGTIYAS